MKCGEVMKLLLEGRIDDPGVKAHLAECRECAVSAELIARLEAEGEAMRADDLSADAVGTTTQRVAALLAAPEADRAVPLLRRPLLRPALAAAALLIIAVGLALVISHKETLPEHPTSSELAMQKEITELRCSLMDRLGEFRSKYQTRSRVSHLAVRRARLRNRMNIVAFEVKQDLEGTRRSRSVPAAVPEDAGQALNTPPMQRRKHDEDTAQHGMEGTRDTGNRRRTVAVADSSGPGAQT